MKVQKYKDGSEESDSGSDMELLDNKLESEGEAPRVLSDSDDEDDFNVKKNANKKPAEMDSGLDTNIFILSLSTQWLNASWVLSSHMRRYSSRLAAGGKRCAATPTGPDRATHERSPGPD